jgi:hypothetical protein
LRRELRMRLQRLSCKGAYVTRDFRSRLIVTVRIVARISTSPLIVNWHGALRRITQIHWCLSQILIGDILKVQTLFMIIDGTPYSSGQKSMRGNIV